jgi:hypothetical protein
VISCLPDNGAVREMSTTRHYALIGTMIILGVLAGVVYASKVDTRPEVLTVGDPILRTVEERAAYENEAIEIALADPRVKPLVEGREVTIRAVFGTLFEFKFYENSTDRYFAQWDGKYRASVYLRYPDDTGYGIEVNITDLIVGEPRKVVWGEKGTFHFIN